MNGDILAISRLTCDNMLIAGVWEASVSAKPGICITSNIREARIPQLLLELSPVLKRFLSQTINWQEGKTARTAQRYERLYR